MREPVGQRQGGEIVLAFSHRDGLNDSGTVRLGY